MKKPDNVAENPGLLPYGSNLGAPSIKPNDISIWKQKGVLKVNREFETRFEELKFEYLKLIDEFRWNDLVYNSKYSFEPIIGETYHLYENSKEEMFLSMIQPTEWNQKHIGSFQLDSKNKWIKI